MTGVSVKWMGMEQNFLPSGTIFKPDAQVRVDVFPVAVFHSFRLGKQSAQVLAALVPGFTKGNIQPSTPGISGVSFRSEGLADGFLGLKWGLIGAQARNLGDFASETPRYAMYGYVRYWYSGTYNRNEAVSMGTNRQTIQFSLPMSIPMGKNKKSPFWLELVPAVELFTVNREPALAPGGGRLSQSPIISLESHLTKNLSPQWWFGLGLRYYYGGETELDGTKQENLMQVLAAGGIVGWEPSRNICINLTYGNVLWGYRQSAVEMIRLSVLFKWFH